jgi:hypothetical protein
MTHPFFEVKSALSGITLICLPKFAHIRVRHHGHRTFERCLYGSFGQQVADVIPTNELSACNLVHGAYTPFQPSS